MPPEVGMWVQLVPEVLAGQLQIQLRVESFFRRSALHAYTSLSILEQIYFYYSNAL